MAAYLDHDMISGLGKQDFLPAELNALNCIMDNFLAGKCALTTSTLSAKELDPYQGPLKPAIQKIYDALSKVPYVEDHNLLGYNTYGDSLTWICSPLVEDDPIASNLKSIGLDRTDAHHLMIAIRAKCETFITCDKRIISRREKIEALHSIKVVKPSEFVVLL